MNAAPRSTPIPDGGPVPWRITAGPHLIAQTMIDGRAWLFTLAHSGRERPLTVAVTHQALDAVRWTRLPVHTREAIQTDGRSEAARVAQFDDPTSFLVLGRDG